MMHSLSNSLSKRLFEFARILAVLVAAAASGRAGEMAVEVKDASGRPVQGAVVAFRPSSGAPRISPVSAEITQEDKRFLPPLTVVPVGSRVRFPNRDTVAHHVYSFSAAKKFDIPLYSGEAPVDVLFDRAGVVSLGCNIHDWMTAHIYVTDTPFWVLTDGNGRAVLRGMPPAPGTVEVWHPRLRGDPVQRALAAGEKLADPVVLKLRPAFNRRQAPASGDEAGVYR